MDATPYTPILRHLVDELPDAIGAVFADWEGEAVDQFPASPEGDDNRPGSRSSFDLRLLGAHFGVVLNHVRAVLHLFHYGEPLELILQHDRLDVLIHSVSSDYYLFLGLRAGAHLAHALRELRWGAAALRAEL
jgi:predicted regulator of Ras-like GTPase activity (Roadblock/LC7/MglB family)